MFRYGLHPRSVSQSGKLISGLDLVAIDVEHMFIMRMIELEEST